ncbi:putative aldouronate transport system permease protein [Paenibacillus castaneae]|uniref:ABC transporter permease n=1 Tax=Paenibacillus castaneae TaxID=474957 RepID=UPI000C9BA88A|nr:ABC transporter permease subunit [Paenibacillus castaneae]NIK76993.1 putative aldouronate transport system permease protein [Paenibacillus castaneae]
MENTLLKKNNSSLISRVLKSKEIYFLILPGVIWYVIFAYVPMYGLSLAFKTYKANLGIFGSPWVGFENFTYVFRDPAFLESVWRTLWINLGRILFQFPFPILLALLLNEIRMNRYKKAIQTVYTFPHFLSWIIVSSVLINSLDMQGFVNGVIQLLGGDPVNFLGNTQIFRPLLYITDNWKSAGWTMIIYLAAITGIDTEQYESAQLDGATRFQIMRYITLPGIQSTIVVMLILTVGNLMNAGFDQIFNISNAATAKAGEILDIYIYRITFQSAADFSFSSTVSLFRSVINFALLLFADRVCKWMGAEGLFPSMKKKARS